MPSSSPSGTNKTQPVPAAEPRRADGIDRDVSGPVATLSLSRGEARNALSDSFLFDIVSHLQELDGQPEIGCIIIAGQQRFFSAGADLSELVAREPIDVLLGYREQLWRAVRDIRTPLVAAVSGYCLGGGCELALSCDLIVAGSTARFGQPETGIGLIPGGGGSQLLARILGPVLAADMVLTGRQLDAATAHRHGLVARVCGEHDWLETAQRVAQEIAARPRVAQLLAKRALRAALEMPLSAGIGFERAAYQVALASVDAREGLSSFVDRREPNWSGR